jgi:hypothetical protein
MLRKGCFQPVCMHAYSSNSGVEGMRPGICMLLSWVT